MPKELPQINVDSSKNRKQWFIFPDMLSGRRFKGYEVRDEETQNRGAFVVGQNVSFGKNAIPTLRPGYSVIGTEANNSTPVTRAWVFETRDGYIFELKAYDTGVYYWLKGYSTEYQLLKSGFTANLEFGYGNIGASADTIMYTYFCNGTENFFRFSGAFGQYASDNGSNTITVSGSTTLANLGFTATGSIVINGTTISYTGLSGQTFTGCSAVPSSPTVGDLIVQMPVEMTGAIGGGLDPVDGQVVMAHDGRLHSRNETKKSVWLYSKLDDPDDYTTGATDSSGGAKEIEFSGPITAFQKLNKTALAFKKRLIKTLDFIQVGDRIDVPKYATLLPTDDKGSTFGAINQKSTFSTPIGVVFTTPDKRMILLTGVTQNDQPQYIVLSEAIQPVFDTGVHDKASGICFENEIWYTFKQDENSTFNDVVIRGDLTRQTTLPDGRIIPIVWDTPFIGLNVSDWTIVFDASDNKNELHWHSSINSNTYEMIEDKVDNTVAFTGIVRTWAEDFDAPQHTKKADEAFVEIKMNDNSEIPCTVLYDENGITEQIEFTLRGTDANNKFDDTEYNPFGASPYGRQRYGSNDIPTGKAKYRFQLELKPNTEFFNISLQLGSEGENQDFELIRFGYRLIEVKTEFERKYKKIID